jgi:hypothetical protein
MVKSWGFAKLSYELSNANIFQEFSLHRRKTCSIPARIG